MDAIRTAKTSLQPYLPISGEFRKFLQSRVLTIPMYLLLYSIAFE
jgi:hypothetical protein